MSILLCIASLQAMPVKSNYGGRSIGGMTAAGVSAKDYVQDGLVTLFDAIENVGWGIHDETVRKVENLVPGNTAWEIPSFVSFAADENGLYFHRAEAVRYNMPQTCFATAKGAPNWQMDVVCMPLMLDIYGDSGFIVASGGLGWWMRPLPALRTRNMAEEVPIVTSQEKVSLSVRPAPSDSTYVEFYKNNLLFVSQKATVGSIPAFNVLEFYANGARGFDMKLYCIRVYNRALTAEEIAHNYAIDKERFGL